MKTIAEVDGGGGLFRGKEKSLWDFWKHGVTSSFLDLFLTCREQTRLAYVQGWAAKGLPLAIEFGTCVHWVLEQCYGHVEPMKRMLSGARAVEQATDMAKDMVATYEKKWRSETINPTQKQLEQQEMVYGLAEAVLPAYFDRWSGDFTGKYKYKNNTTAPVKWRSLEQVFRRDFFFDDGAGTFLNGRRDGVFEDRRARPWVFDTKCLSMINDDDILDTLPHNLQQMLYLWITHEEMVQNKEKNPWPAGVIMNVVRRPGQRRLQDETLPVFLERVRKEVSNPKNFDHYFIRYEMAISKGELQHWHDNTLVPILKDVRGWWEGTYPHYETGRNLVTKYGRCGMFLPITKKEFSGCYKRKHVFNELAEV